MTVEQAQKTLERWTKTTYNEGEYNHELMLSSYCFRKYSLNIFLLNSKALLIQHSFFGIRAGVRKVIPKKKEVRKVTQSFINEPAKLSSSKSVDNTNPPKKFKTQKSLHGYKKDEQYQKQLDEKKEREQRIIEARKKYGSGARLTKSSKASTRPGTAEKSRPQPKATKLVKEPSITDAELQNVMKTAWAKVEMDKQKKMVKNLKPKKPALRSQESINEEKLVHQIVSKAWVEADQIKKKKEMTKKKLSANKPATKKKQPLRSQESINEERLLGQIMSEAWVKAEEIKKETMKTRKKNKIMKSKPKLHSQQSIMEEMAVQNIVNKAWKDVYNGEKEEKLQNICENAMENESSFDGSESDGERYSTEKTHKMKTIEQIATNTLPSKPKARRSRANRMGSKDYTASKSKILSTTSQVSYQPLSKRSPFKEANQNSKYSYRAKKIIEVENLDPDVKDEDLIISPVKENRQLLTENYLNGY